MKRALLLLLALPGIACGGAGGPAPVPSPAPTPAPSIAPTPTPPPPPCGSGVPVQGEPPLTKQLVAKGLDLPLELRQPPGDPTRLMIAEQTGRIRLVRNGVLERTPYLDIRSEISLGELGEGGLLGFIFHPRYADNGRLFAVYTARGLRTRLVEFRRGSPDAADASTERLLFSEDQPFANHNGGGLGFGPDGRLYVGLGDGGGRGDPLKNGQNLGTRLGKMLRIDVDGASPYGIPADNPFVTQGGVTREVWAYGLRNPWRFSFDRENIYIADVGHTRREEVNVVASTEGGVNYGWSITEGSLCFEPSSNCNTAGIRFPVLEYGHEFGCAITGGYVYRGCRMPGYQGTYFYSDYCSSMVRSFRFAGGGATDPRDWSRSLSGDLDAVTSFGVDNDGELYIVDFNGKVYKIVPAG